VIALVAAMDRNRVIGRDGRMPWHLPADLAHFRRLTRGHAVLMGRKTYQSIGGPLKGRTNLVLTRDRSFVAPGCTVVHDIADLLRAVRPDQGPLFVIGGAEIYQLFLPHAGVLHLTRIDAEFEGDTFFPAWDPAAWERTEALLRPKDEQNPHDCTFETWRRAAGAHA
jgi:dihydrofolate reductase